MSPKICRIPSPIIRGYVEASTFLTSVEISTKGEFEDRSKILRSRSEISSYKTDVVLAVPSANRTLFNALDVVLAVS